MAESASAAAIAAIPEPDVKMKHAGCASPTDARGIGTIGIVKADTYRQDIKIEREVAEAEGPDFAFSPEPPEPTSKRPFEDIAATSESSEPKRAKLMSQTEEASLEDGLALLVQNALSNVDDLIDRFACGSEEVDTTPSDPMEVETSLSLPEPVVPRPNFAAEPLKFIRDASLHALGNLAFSILLILVQPPFEDTIQLIRGTESEHTRSFHQLKVAFEHVRRLYSAGLVLTADGLALQDSESRTLIELANLVQLGSWLVDGSPEALSEADENFLALFQCQLADLPPGMTELYLSIKTQRAIEFIVEKVPEKPPEELIGEVLTQGLEDVLKEQHGDGELSSADQDFVSSVQTQKEILEGEIKEQAEPSALRDKHPAEDLLRSYLGYAKSKLKTLTDLGDKLGVPIHMEDGEPEPEHVSNVEATGDADLDLDDLSSFFEKTASGLVQDALAGLTDEAGAKEASTAAPAAPGEGETSAEAANAEREAEGASTQTNGKIDLMTDYKELEALVAESTSNYVKTTLHGLSPVPYQATVPTSTAESMASHLPYLAQLQHHQAQNPYYGYAPPPPPPDQQALHQLQHPPATGEDLPPNQTFPSAILYDKARQAALSKSSAHTRREGLHSTRRPWTQEEEKALMAGLDMVKGPHWSQILTIFGQNGTISDILRDRTQVQLKDKARNLKLFFLKTNSEMPYYLQAVTGELKTRAPTQAARKEAEERARLTSDEDQARLQGIMTLAGGLQHPPQRTSASPAISNGTGSSTPAPAPPATPSAPSAPSAQHQAGKQNNNAGGTQKSHASIPRPTAPPTSPIRPGVQTNTQQLLHAVAQAHQRAPHTQLPPPVPRPQGQQQQQAQPSPHASTTPQPPSTTNGQSWTQTQTQTQPAASQQSHGPAAQKPATTTDANGHTASATASSSSSSLALPPQVQQQPAVLAASAADRSVASSASTVVPQQQDQPGAEAQQQQQQQPQQGQGQGQELPPMAPPQAAQQAAPQATMHAEVPSAEEQDDNAAEAALLKGLQAVVAQTPAS
ncbi:hypothetical protein E4U41_004204 [Claviceps citrina]|nr:hypothetical protein E4U41_004204 [Claviceps citrina]